MSRGKMHSPFEIFLLFCLLFLNTEVLNIQLILVLLWADTVVSVLPTSSLMVLPSFSIRYPEVGVRLKSSAGNNAKWAIEKPHNSCHSAYGVCWAAPALFPWHPPLSCLAALPLLCFHLRRGGVMWAMAAPGCSQGSGHGQSCPMRLWPPGSGAGWGDKLPSGARAACVQPLAHLAKGLFFILPNPSRRSWLAKQPRCEPRVPTEPDSCGSGGCLPVPSHLGRGCSRVTQWVKGISPMPDPGVLPWCLTESVAIPEQTTWSF